MTLDTAPETTAEPKAETRSFQAEVSRLLDIVAHSRGGLVARAIAEHPELTDRRLHVERSVGGLGREIVDDDDFGVTAGCEQSSSSYPYLVAERLRLHLPEMRYDLPADPDEASGRDTPAAAAVRR